MLADKQLLLMISLCFMCRARSVIPREPITIVAPYNHKNSIDELSARISAGPLLTYRGGMVTSNVQVVQVLWGAGKYDSSVSATTTPSMATFFQRLLNDGPLTAWLNSEYRTTKQNFSTGSFAGLYTINPSANANKTLVTDDQLKAELRAQIQAGFLPPAITDSSGHSQTYYALFFPPGVVVQLGPYTSCDYFCGYHSTVLATKYTKEFYYGVHPDMQPQIGGCDCGGGNIFQDYCQVASHELVEAMTDPGAGVGRLTWYDDANGEIGDICNGATAPYYACDGETYLIQLEYSNREQKCVDLPIPPCILSTSTLSPSNSQTPTNTPTISQFITNNIPSLAPDAVPSLSLTPTSPINGNIQGVIGSKVPSIAPSLSPSTLPSLNPTFVPTYLPTSKPTFVPSKPTITPTNPTIRPTTKPSSPTKTPTKAPLSKLPTKAPLSKLPTKAPKSKSPTRIPTTPTKRPTSAPSTPSRVPTSIPSVVPTSLALKLVIVSNNDDKTPTISNYSTYLGTIVIIIVISTILVLCAFFIGYRLGQRNANIMEDLKKDSTSSIQNTVQLDIQDNKSANKTKQITFHLPDIYTNKIESSSKSICSSNNSRKSLISHKSKQSVQSDDGFSYDNPYQGEYSLSIPNSISSSRRNSNNKLEPQSPVTPMTPIESCKSLL